MLFTAAALTSIAVAVSLLTGAVRRYALSRHLLDVPNSRSSHAVPTPRGGGISIVAVSIVSMVVLGIFALMPWHDVIAMAGGGALVASVGFIDDHRHLDVAWRLVAHFAAAVWLLAWMSTASGASWFGTLPFTLGTVAAVVGVLYVVWVLNLTNFMDGIDGLAAVEATTVCGGGALLTYFAIPHTALWMLPVVIAAASVGFLAWNRPPARIFMGDVGSGFLGFIFAGLALQGSREAPILFWSWTILLGVFVADATTTLVRRFVRGENVSSAHRSHAYQHAAVRYAAHGPVTAAAAAINVLWLLPIASLVVVEHLNGAVALVLAYAPLVVLAVWLGAGVTGRQRA